MIYPLIMKMNQNSLLIKLNLSIFSGRTVGFFKILDHVISVHTLEESTEPGATIVQMGGTSHGLVLLLWTGSYECSALLKIRLQG